LIVVAVSAGPLSTILDTDRSYLAMKHDEFMYWFYIVVGPIAVVVATITAIGLVKEISSVANSLWRVRKYRRLAAA
jgi:hypothetical protein